MAQNSYIKNAFNVVTYPATFNIRMNLRRDADGATAISSFIFYASKTLSTLTFLVGGTSGVDYQQLFTRTNITTNTIWYSVSFNCTITNSELKHLYIRGVRGGSPSGAGTPEFYIKGLQIIQYLPAEVQDSDMLNKNILYEGTKISSTDINIDSPDTIDGGPVITVNTVSPSTPSSNPIGTSIVVGNNTALEGRALVNRSPSSNVS